MDCFVFYEEDTASFNTFNLLLEEKERLLLKKYVSQDPNIKELYKNDKITIINSNKELIHSEYLDNLSFENIFFISKHISSAKITSFTTHSTGNWLSLSEYGGKPASLSVSAPSSMLSFLHSINSSRVKTIDSLVTYEATHHGPLLKTPSLFLEFGGSESAINNLQNAEIMKEIILSNLDYKISYKKIVFGIGSGHLYLTVKL